MSIKPQIFDFQQVKTGLISFGVKKMGLQGRLKEQPASDAGAALVVSGEANPIFSQKKLSLDFFVTFFIKEKSKGNQLKTSSLEIFDSISQKKKSRIFD